MIPIIVVGNKVDLQKEQVNPITLLIVFGYWEHLQIQDVSTSERYEFAVSARTGENVEEVFKSLALKMILARNQDKVVEISSLKHKKNSFSFLKQKPTKAV